MRMTVTLYGVAETYKGNAPFTVVAVKAEVYKTGYKLRIPDLDPQRIHVLRAFHHGSWVWRHRWGNDEHLLSREGAIKHFIKGLEHDIDSGKEKLVEMRRALRHARGLR